LVSLECRLGFPDLYLMTRSCIGHRDSILLGKVVQVVHGCDCWKNDYTVLQQGGSLRVFSLYANFNFVQKMNFERLP